MADTYLIPLRYTCMLCFLLLQGVAPSALAEQLNFQKTQKGDATDYYYRWLDADNEVQEIRFRLPHTAFKAAPTLQPNYKPSLAQRFVTVALMKKAKTYDPKDARIAIKNDNQRINIEVRSQSETRADVILEELQAEQVRAFNAYLEQNYYVRFTTIFNQGAVKPDHLRYVEETTKALVPVSQAFYEKIRQDADARDYFDLLLGWIQSIPYDTLEDRVASNGSGFAPPVGLLNQNLGDCDSKAVLTSALVRAFLPTTDMAMVFLPNHALLAVALTPLIDDSTIQIDGRDFVLYDPTGPALLPFGQVSESTQRYLQTGRYQIEVID